MTGQQLDLLRDGLDYARGRYRATDPATSRQGARSVQPRAGTQKALLLAAFASYPLETGLTDEQAAERAGVSLASEYSKRCGELRQAGLIRQLFAGGEPVTRSGSAGVPRIVSTVTDLGREVARG